MARENNKILVISKYGLEARRFDRRSNNWKKSEIRQWLNGDFYNTAFNEKEKKYIQLFDGDNVFFLSKEETEKYFANDVSRQSEATEYAKANGAWVGDNACSYWWLRSPDPNSLNCLYGVGNYGNFYDYYGVYGGKTVARPAL